MSFAILAYIFIFFAWSRALLRYRDKLISFLGLIFWSFVWLGATVIIGWPGITAQLAIKFGIGRGVDVVVYISIIVLFYLLFRIYIKINALEQEITRLIRALALKKEKS